MKVYVTHDKEGNIASVNMPNPEAKILVLPESGHRVCEVNVAGRASDFADQNEATAKLLDIVQAFRIDVPVSKGKLVSLKKQAIPKKRAASKKVERRKKRDERVLELFLLTVTH